jgi:hypothetical protein
MHAAAAGDKFANDGLVVLYIENDDSNPTTLTLDDPNTPVPAGSSANNDASTTIAAGAKKFWGPFKRSRFNDEDGLVSMSWSNTTDVNWTVVSANAR